MKSIIKTKIEKKLLSVNMDTEANARLNSIMQANGGQVIQADTSDGNEKIGYLLGFKGFAASDKPKQEVAEQCVVFSGVSGSELNLILRQMRDAGIVVALKAVCTAYNQNWTLSDLVCELEKEHKAMTGGGNNE